MKLLAYLLMTICLCLGTLAAVTAYSPSLSRPDDQLIGLTLNADAGAVPGEPADDAPDGAAPEMTPIGTQDDVISPELLAELRQNGVERVRVKEFSFGRWDHWWMMLVACGGLIVGALLVKYETRQQIAKEMAVPSDSQESPTQAIRHAAGSIEQLLRDLEDVPSDHDKMVLIIDRIGQLQREHLTVIVDARAKLIAKLSLLGYAQFMDRFSAMERQINRAWSAAADGVLDESMECLHNAHALVPEVMALIEGK